MEMHGIDKALIELNLIDINLSILDLKSKYQSIIYSIK